MHARCSLARTLDGTDGRTGTEGEMDGVDAMVHACMGRFDRRMAHAYRICVVSIDANAATYSYAAAKEDSALAVASRTQRPLHTRTYVLYTYIRASCT